MSILLQVLDYLDIRNALTLFWLCNEQGGCLTCSYQSLICVICVPDIILQRVPRILVSPNGSLRRVPRVQIDEIEFQVRNDLSHLFFLTVYTYKPYGIPRLHSLLLATKTTPCTSWQPAFHFFPTSSIRLTVCKSVAMLWVLSSMWVKPMSVFPSPQKAPHAVAIAATLATNITRSPFQWILRPKFNLITTEKVALFDTR